MTLKTAVILSVSLIGVTSAIAGTASEIVQSRQSAMKELAAATKVMAGMFKEPRSYSASSFGAAAREIEARAGGRLVETFAHLGAAPGSKATDAIKDDPAHFAELADNLKTYATALESAARDHPEAMTDDMRMKAGEAMEGGLLGVAPRSSQKMSAEHAFHLMLQTCASCHSRFREKS